MRYKKTFNLAALKRLFDLQYLTSAEQNAKFWLLIEELNARPARQRERILDVLSREGDLARRAVIIESLLHRGELRRMHPAIRRFVIAAEALGRSYYSFARDWKDVLRFLGGHGGSYGQA